MADYVPQIYKTLDVRSHTELVARFYQGSQGEQPGSEPGIQLDRFHPRLRPLAAVHLQPVAVRQQRRPRNPRPLLRSTWLVPDRYIGFASGSSLDFECKSF